jgi:hypothetical protein
MSKICKPEYLAQVQLLTKEETERLLSRMSGKLPSRLKKDKLSEEEALAIQLELEDEQLQDWRKMMHILKKDEEAKAPSKSKVAEHPSDSQKHKADKKAKPASKPEATVKAKVQPKK